MHMAVWDLKEEKHYLSGSVGRLTEEVIFESGLQGQGKSFPGKTKKEGK